MPVYLDKEEYKRLIRGDSTLYQEIIKRAGRYSGNISIIYNGPPEFNSTLLSVAIALKQDLNVIEKICKDADFSAIYKPSFSQLKFFPKFEEIYQGFRLALWECKSDENRGNIIAFFLKEYPGLLSELFSKDRALAKSAATSLIKSYLDLDVTNQDIDDLVLMLDFAASMDDRDAVAKIYSLLKIKLDEPKALAGLTTKDLIVILDIAVSFNDKELAKKIGVTLKERVDEEQAAPKDPYNNSIVAQQNKVLKEIFLAAINYVSWAALRYFLEENKNYYDKYDLIPPYVHPDYKGLYGKDRFILSILYHLDNNSSRPIPYITKYYGEMSEHLPKGVHLIDLFQQTSDSFESFEYPANLPSRGRLLWNYLNKNQTQITAFAKDKTLKEIVFEYLETGFDFYEGKNDKLLGKSETRYNSLQRYMMVNHILNNSEHFLYKFFATHRHSKSIFNDTSKDTNHIQKLRALRIELSTSVEFLQQRLNKDENTGIGELLYLFLINTDEKELKGKNLPENYLSLLAKKPGYKKALWDYIKDNKDALKEELNLIESDKKHPLNLFFASHRNSHSIFNNTEKETTHTKKMAGIYKDIKAELQQVRGEDEPAPQIIKI